MAVDIVYYIGKLDKKIYSCITDDIITDDVIITDERINHIKARHPDEFEMYRCFIKEAVEQPDYIIEANKEKTAVILKSFDFNGRTFKTILRLATSTDNPAYKNSVITLMKIDEKDWNRLLRNKKTLYKSE